MREARPMISSSSKTLERHLQGIGDLYLSQTILYGTVEEVKVCIQRSREIL